LSVKAAHALALVIPQAVSIRADHVIQ